jgi:hypothetical protein
MLLFAALAYGLVDHGVGLGANILGINSDPRLVIWCLAWWPWALAHHLDPLFTNLVWAPGGVDLVWTTCVPALAALGAPVTLLAGPVVAFNLLAIAAPALAAAGAYGLCLYVTGRPLASIVGALFYGFSTYEMAESLSHLNLSFNAAVPLLLLVVLARLDGRLGRGAAAGLAGALIAFEFYVCMEVAASALLFGGLAWALALRLLPARRPALRRLVADGMLAGAVCAILVSPFLWDMLRTPRGTDIPLGWSYVSAAHLFNLLVTTPRIVFSDPNVPVSGNSWILHAPQWDFSTGLPLLVIIALFWREAGAPSRLLVAMLAAALLASLGPQLWFGAHFTSVVMPWVVMLAVPLLKGALPVRFALYATLALALIAALWVARGGRGRAAAALLAWALTVAAPHVSRPAPLLDFFRPGRLEAVLGASARVLILPGPTEDNSAFWQAENGFGFAQVTGDLGIPPFTARAYAGVNDIAFNRAPPGLAADLAAYAQASGARFVIAGPDARPAMVRAMAASGWPARRVDEVTIYTVPAHG